MSFINATWTRLLLVAYQKKVPMERGDIGRAKQMGSFVF